MTGRVAALALATLVAGCGGSSKPPPAPAAPATATAEQCARAGDAMAAQHAEPVVADRVGLVVERSCREDGWTPAEATCVAEAPSPDHDCQHVWTDDHAARLRLRMDAEVAAVEAELAAAASSRLPACERFVTIAERLATCEALPDEVRQRLRDTIQQLADATPRIPPEQRPTVAQGCLIGAEQLAEAARMAGCPLSP